MDSPPTGDSFDRCSYRSNVAQRVDEAERSLPESCFFHPFPDGISSQRCSIVFPSALAGEEDDAGTDEMTANHAWMELHTSERESPGFVASEPADPRWWEPLVARATMAPEE
jgi:hypothetical protein